MLNIAMRSAQHLHYQKCSAIRDIAEWIMAGSSSSWSALSQDWPKPSPKTHSQSCAKFGKAHLIFSIALVFLKKYEFLAGGSAGLPALETGFYYILALMPGQH